jgi:hypothetical protein
VNSASLCYVNRYLLTITLITAALVSLSALKARSQEDVKLDKVWVDRDSMRVGDFRVLRECSQAGCRLAINRGRKSVWSTEVEQGRPDWVRYGFFQFLPGKRKQLIVHTYSGGAHCCYDYAIFEIQGRRLEKLYDSSRYDSANEIGNELVPIDINQDGTYEFYQDVMAFDYMGFAGHASATFPPAIFWFDKRHRKFVLANKRFSSFVLRRMEKNLANLKEWQRENNERTGGHPDMTRITDDELSEVAVREKFLDLVYAGKEREAWPYFKRSYKSSGGDGYQEQFRAQFIRDFRKAFDNDPTYLSIYQSRKAERR